MFSTRNLNLFNCVLIDYFNQIFIYIDLNSFTILPMIGTKISQFPLFFKIKISFLSYFIPAGINVLHYCISLYKISINMFHYSKVLKEIFLFDFFFRSQISFFQIWNQNFPTSTNCLNKTFILETIYSSWYKCISLLYITVYNQYKYFPL